MEIYGSVLSVEFSKLPPTRYHQDKTADSSIVTNADSQKGLKQSEQSTAPKADIYIERKSVQSLYQKTKPKVLCIVLFQSRTYTLQMSKI